MGVESLKPASTPTGAVFLSYASQDAEAAARICNALRAAGIEVWFDQSELRGGDAWDRHIRRHIHDCALFLPIISAHSDARQEGYFRREWRLAVERAGDMAEDVAFLVPVVIDGTKDATARVPDRFREVQWSHVPDGHAPPAFTERVRRLLSPEPSHVTTIAQESANPVAGGRSVAGVPPRSWLSRPALLAAALVVTVGGAYLVVDRFVLSKGAAPLSTSIAHKSIAVLPFADLSEKRDQEYFAEGLAEEILDLLAKIPGLKVIGRSSSFAFKGNGSDLHKVGAALGVAHLVEGSVRKLDSRVRVTVQLIDVQDGTHRWSETYDRDAADSLSLQREIATAVARALQVSVSDYFGPGGTKSAEAYDLYLRGIRDVDSSTREAELRATSEFSKAVETDPAYVNAWVGLADAYDVAATDNVAPRAETYALARLAVDKALALDPMNADAHAMRAFIRMNVWDWNGAEDDIRRSQSIRKTSGALQAAGKLARIRGNLAEAESNLRDTLALDPLDTFTLFELASFVYPRLGRFEDADQLFARLRAVSADVVMLNANQSWNAVLAGKYDLAVRLAETEKDPEGREMSLAIAYTATHDLEKSGQALERLLRIPTVSEYFVADVYAYRGEKDLSFQYLEKAYANHSVDLQDLKTDPFLSSLRTEQRYKVLLHRMGLPE